MESKEESLEKVAALAEAKGVELLVLAEKCKTQLSFMRELKKRYSLTMLEANELRKAVVVLSNTLSRGEA